MCPLLHVHPVHPAILLGIVQRCSVPGCVVQVLLDEGHSMTHMVHIWQLIVRHADLFYASR